MSEKSRVNDAIIRLAKYCAYQDRCKKEIDQKLYDLELSESEKDQVWEYLIKENYHDEERYVRSIVRGRFFYKSWGRVKIRYYLAQQGIDSTIVEDVIQHEIKPKDYHDKIRALVQSKLGLKESLTFEEKQKMIRSLYQKGYESDLVISELENLGED